MKKYFKFVISLVIILNLIINIAYASMQVPNDNKTVIQEVDRLQKIKEKGILTVLSGNLEPFSYRNTKTDKFSGIDADIIQEVANRLGFKEVRVKYVSFSTVLESLIKNPQFDLIGQGLAITDERKQLLDFTIPLYTDEDAILTRNDTYINTKENLKNATIGVIGGTIFIPIVEKWKEQGMVKDYMIFNDNDSLEVALKTNVVEAILIGSITEQNYLLKNPNLNLKLLSPDQYKTEIKIYFGYALRKEDTILLNAINEKLEDMKKDGTLYQILVKHGIRDRYILYHS